MAALGIYIKSMIITYKQTRLLVLWMTGILICCLIGFKCVRFIKNMANSTADYLGSTDKLPTQYNDLFDLKTQKLFANIHTEVTRGGVSISYFDYNEKYSMMVTCIKMQKESSLRTVLKDTIGEVSSSYGIYMVFSLPTIEIDYIAKPTAATDLVLKLSGNSLTELSKTDSVASYFINMKGFSIQYKKGGSKNIVGEVVDGNTIPTDFLFLKKNKNVYVIMMTGNKIDYKIRSTSLNDIVLKQTSN